LPRVRIFPSVIRQKDELSCVQFVDFGGGATRGPLSGLPSPGAPACSSTRVKRELSQALICLQSEGVFSGCAGAVTWPKNAGEPGFLGKPRQ
jgi:hypothetical protein